MTISITEQTTSGGNELNFGELPQKRYKITNEAIAAVDRTNSQQQSSIEYNDNDITGSSSSNPASNEFIYTNSFHDSNKMNQQSDK